MNRTETKNTVINFISRIWNEQKFEEIDNLLHVDFIDHSLPVSLPPNKDGLKRWISGTGQSFEHKTTIEEQVTEGNKAIIIIRMDLTHIGRWRDIEPTGIKVSAVGYRYFVMEEGKIKEHFGLIDGNAIENQLRQAAAGCKIQE